MTSAARGRAEAAARLLSGAWTPFLSPAWGEAERSVVADFVQHGRAADGRRQLAEAVAAVTPGRLVPTGSGRAAIQAVLLAAGLPVGSEVVLPAFSCAGVIEPVLAAGLNPVLADVDSDLNLDADSVRAALSPRTRAVIAPHLGGVWSQARDAVAALAAERDVLFIEDAAQSAGLRGPDGQLAGLSAPVGIFSTGVGKPLFGPGGGFAVVHEPALAERLADVPLLPDPPETVRARVDSFLARFAASTSRRGAVDLRRAAGSRLRGTAAGRRRHPDPLVAMSDVEASIAALRWGALDEQLRLRADHARRWHALLAESGLGDLRTAPLSGNSFSKFWLDCSSRGPALAAHMRSALWRSGVETESLYLPLHLREEFRGCRTTDLRRTEALAPVVFSLPVRPDLDDADWRRIERAVHALSA